MTIYLTNRIKLEDIKKSIEGYHKYDAENMKGIEKYSNEYFYYRWQTIHTVFSTLIGLMYNVGVLEYLKPDSIELTDEQIEFVCAMIKYNEEN